MPKSPHIELSDDERSQLERWVKNPPRPYLRQRAWAILLLAARKPAYKVAEDRRVRVHRGTVAEWIRRFQAERVDGLRIRPGRGRKPVFAPRTQAEAQAQIETVLHQPPRAWGILRSRWRLQDLGRAIAWLDGVSEPGIHKVLRRLGFSRKQALHFVHSPDPHYHAKLRAILAAFKEACEQPDKVVILFLDELTYHRRPSKAPAYHAQGKQQPKAMEAAQANTQTRLVAALNGFTGQVLYLQRSKIGQEALMAFYAQVRAAYPQAEKIYLVQDNWPTHMLPAVLDALHTQRLTPLFLPTYASWLNPIEKLWRWLKQDVLHLHPWAEALETLRKEVVRFLDQFTNGSDLLLRYVGLLPE